MVLKATVKGVEEEEERHVPLPTLCKRCVKMEYRPECVAVVNGTDVEALRDTGASHCVVAEELVREDQYTGETAT